MHGGTAWSGEGFGQGEDLQAQARKLWEAWSASLRGNAAANDLPEADWQQALQWWSQLLPKTAPGSPLGDTLGRFNAQARDWYAQMQLLAAHFAGREAQPAEIVAMWRELLGAKDSGGDPFAEIFRAMHGRGPHGLDAWIEQALPWLQMLSAAGFGGEHGQRWKPLEELLRDYRARNDEYNALMQAAVEQAFALFERKLGERAGAGARPESARALFDTWIDAAEEAYSQLALSAEFRHVLGALGNAQIRLRAAMQKEVEQAGELFGMPTRQEVDAAHRKIAELERTLWRMQRAQAAPAQERRAAAPKKPVAKKSPVKKAVPVAKKAAVKKSAAKKSVAKKPAKKATARRGGR